MCPSSTGDGSKLILAFFFDEHPFASYSREILPVESFFLLC